MKKIALALGIAMAAAAPVSINAAELNVSVTSQGAPMIDVAPGSLIPFEVTMTLSDTINEGLNFFHFDLRFDGGDLSPVGEPRSGPLVAFVAPNGVTNPEGYGGVFVGGRLRQIGGSQNTLKLTGPLPLPSGAVVTGVGHSPITVASGSLTVPAGPGTYVLRAEDVLGRVIRDGEDGSGPIWLTEWAFRGSVQDLTINVRTCAEACADADANGIRDDNCVWVTCQPDGQTCDMTPIIFGDLGGAFGACEPDGFVNLFDRTHALTCFAGTNRCSSLNIDAGGPFGNCNPDGFCNLFDVSHALTSFAGTNPCSCSVGGPMPEWTPPEPAGSVVLWLAKASHPIKPGDMVEIEVFAEPALGISEFPALAGYQLQLGVSGGRGGLLQLKDILIDRDRRDFAFSGRDDVFHAMNLERAQVFAGLDNGSVTVPPKAYLATFVYRSTSDAEGAFVVDVLTSEPNGNQTFLIADRGRSISLDTVLAASVEIKTGKPLPPLGLGQPGAK